MMDGGREKRGERKQGKNFEITQWKFQGKMTHGR